MVFKNIQRIKDALPDVIHIAMFYNNGIIFQTTFEQDINIPILGENLAELVENVQKIYNVSNLEYRQYKKLVIETERSSIIVLKLGEESNIALFFEAEQTDKIKLNSIRRYLKRIEKLIDINEKEILLNETLEKENELKSLYKQLMEVNEKLEELRNYKEEKELESEKESFLEEYNKLKEEIEKKEKELGDKKAKTLNID